MTEELDAQLLVYIKALSEEDAKEYFIGKRIVDQFGGDRGTVTEIRWFSGGAMDFKRSDGDWVDYCTGLHLVDGQYYCCTGLRGRIIIGDDGCYKCKHACKMKEPCIFMEEKE